MIKFIGSFLNLLSLFTSQKAAEIALNLFARPRKGKLSENDYSFLTQAKSKQLTYNEYSIQTYNWKGSGKTILLAHGWESNTSRWEYLIPKLQALNLNIIALDAPAHGLSSSTYFNAVLYGHFIQQVVTEFKPSIVIGHSVGGLASFLNLYLYPESSIQKIISLGAPSNVEGVFARYVKMMGYNDVISEKLNQLTKEKIGFFPSELNAAKITKNIQAEILLIHDKNDKVIPFHDALDYEKTLAQATLFSTENLGHGLKQDLVSERIIGFLA